MKKVVIVFFLYLFCLGTSFSSFWNLSGIKIITRQEWDANDKYLFSDYKEYKKIIEQNKHNFEIIKKNPIKYKKYLEDKAKEKTREKYLLTHYKNEVKADKVIKTIDGKKLWWDIAYKKNKDRIIIHHTTADYTRFKNKQEVEKYIRGTYYYHAIKRGWGDIGYNFIIDQFGNIYEGRKGGEGVVGANSKWNNVPSIGVALIGNFEKQKPTKKQVQALENLILALSKKYHIDPYKQVTYHKEMKKYAPYIKDVKNVSIVGHKDTGYTLCPGKNLYILLPSIRKYVADHLKNDIKLANTKVYSKKEIYINKGKKLTLTDKISFTDSRIKNVNKCYTNNNSVSISCYGNKIILTRKKYLGIKYITIKAESNTTKYTIKLMPIFIDDIRYIIGKKSDKYLGSKKTKYFSKKINHKVYLNEAKTYLKKPVKVLLYELSLKKYYEISCKNKCKVITDLKTFDNISKLKIDKLKNYMLLWINNKSYSVKYIDISSKGEITFDNYKRQSYAHIPWNSFDGSIIIKKNLIKNITTHKVYEDFVIINLVNFNDYLNGVAEVNDQVPYEKAKTMALLIKTYVLFYFNKKNIHPSIPKNVSYNTIDDPRSFQKYVGAGYKRTSKKWKKVVKDTENLFLTYNGYIPILPYFNCSAGFTFSAKSKFGWTDTPYLVPNLDFNKCKTFNGHGVGLSGKGAEFLAKKGFKMKNIINWYFPNVKIVK